MKELGITKGEWEVSPDNNWECCVLMGEQEDHYINLENRDIDGWDEMHANATLICDAGNTAQKCGLLPSELLQQRDELKEALQSLMDGVRGLPPLTAIAGVLEKQYKQAEAAIKKTER